jgi:hypothetical protein
MVLHDLLKVEHYYYGGKLVHSLKYETNENFTKEETKLYEFAL